MIEQLPIYLMCYLLGWVPLYSAYRWVELKIPFQLESSKTAFSWLFFYKLMYSGLEILRGYLLMVIAHEFLMLDIDLFLALTFFLVGLFWPPLVQSKDDFPIWLCLTGIYWYLFSLVGLAFPFILFGLLMIGLSIFNAYIGVMAIYCLLGYFFGANSLYLQFYALPLELIASLIIVCIKFSSKKSVYFSDILNESKV